MGHKGVELELPNGCNISCGGEVHVNGKTTVLRVRGPMIEEQPELVWDEVFGRFRVVMDYGNMRLEYERDVPWTGWLKCVSGGKLLDDACYVVSDICCSTRGNYLWAEYRGRRAGLWRVLEEDD
jgi:hypothetical protein